MKTRFGKGGRPEKHFMLSQDYTMHVTFYITTTSGEVIPFGTPLGKWGDIGDPEVKGRIIEQLILKQLL